jgi:hypothetical protein
MSPFPFEQLDFIYTPSDDVARAALIQITEGPPHVLLTDHLEGERSILVYRVADLKRSLKVLQRQGWKREETFEIPHGPCCSFTAPGGHRVALYQLIRPDVAAHFEGRFDF